MEHTNIFTLSALTCALALAGCNNSSDGGNIANVSPTVIIQSISASENTLVTLDATASDSDGSVSSYSWELTSGQTVTLTGDTTSSLSFTTPSVLDAGDTLSFKVVVTDNDGATAEATNTVTVSNIVPSAIVAEQTVDEKDNVSVAATVSGNGNEIVSYLWIQTSGSTVELINADTDTLSFTAPEIIANEVIGLSLTVTDSDDDAVTVESFVNVTQLTIPLSIAGLATDSPITSAQISVNIAGRDITVDVTADENGVYTVDLLLDDLETDVFISIIAQGVDAQANAGLITLLGTAGQLIAMAGDDNTLTEDENFAVNVTNITTAQYALAKVANNGDDITTDEEFTALTQSLNYDEVMTLATAIKVAIDKAVENTDLALPEGTSNTLELVEDIEAAQAYVQEVIDEPEFEEAQEEIHQDDNLIDTSSSWDVPEIYYYLSQGATSGGIYRFNQDSTGSYGNGYNYVSFTWQETEGVINATITDGATWFETHIINDVWLDVEVRDSSYEFKRLSSNNSNDVLLKTRITQYPNGELDDITATTTLSVLKENAVIDISDTGVGVAYLPFAEYESDTDNTRIVADEIILNDDGTAHATVQDDDLTWAIDDGAIIFGWPTGISTTWKQLTTGLVANQFAHEPADNTGESVGKGAILSEPMEWPESQIVGIYTLETAFFSDSLFDHFWFELHENGDAETYSSGDWNEDGTLTEDELSIMYGSWIVNSDGTLTITRVRNEDFGYTEECRYATTEGCVLYHERTWRLIGQQDNDFAVFHKHDFKFSNLDWGDDFLSYDNRVLSKIDSAPVSFTTTTAKTDTVSQASNAPAKAGTKQEKKIRIATRFSKLEPEI